MKTCNTLKEHTDRYNEGLYKKRKHFKKEYDKKYYVENRDKKLAYVSEYRKNPIKKARKNQIQSKRYHSDPQYRLGKLCRNRVRDFLFNHGGSGKYVNCDIVTLKKHMESLFKPGMTWDNYGQGTNKWTIDHIIPLRAFNLLEEEQIKKANHFTNLQPLWHVENVRKR